MHHDARCPTCGGPLIQKDRTRLLLAAFAYLVVGGGASCVAAGRADRDCTCDSLRSHCRVSDRMGHLRQRSLVQELQDSVCPSD